MSRLTTAMIVCLLPALIGAFSAPAHAADSGQTLYWCRHANGNESGQLEPCGPGSTEVRRSAYANGTSQGAPVENIAAAPAPAPAAAPAAPAAPPADSATPAAAPAAASREDTLKQGQKSLLMTLLWGVAGAIVFKLMKRSLFLGFFLGVILRIVLVAAAVIEF